MAAICRHAVRPLQTSAAICRHAVRPLQRSADIVTMHTLASAVHEAGMSADVARASFEGLQMLLEPAWDACRCRSSRPGMSANLDQACSGCLPNTTDVCGDAPRPVGQPYSEPAARWTSCVQFLGFKPVPEIEHARMICASNVTGSTSVPGSAGGPDGRRRFGPPAHLVSVDAAVGLAATAVHPTRDRQGPTADQSFMARRLKVHIAKLISSHRPLDPSQQP